MSPVSNSNSYSSADTNQTLLNSIANQRSGGGGGGGGSSSSGGGIGGGGNNHRQSQNQNQNQSQSSNNKNKNQNQNQQGHSRKYSQFMIITPAVSIDRNFDYDSHLDFEDFANAAHNNGNLFRLGLRRSDSSSDDSGHSSDSSFRSNYNPYLHHSRQHLLSNKGSSSNNNKSSGSARYLYTFSSWRWCTLLCAAMRCFGAGHGNAAPYSSSFVQHHRLRRCSSYNADTAYDYEHFAAPFKARKTRDHMNNITYEL